MENGHAQILFVEDNEDHVYLIEKALSRLVTDGKVKLDVVTDGEAAISYVQNQGAFKNRPQPDLIFLDIKLPKKDGFEVLQELKQDERCKHIPIVMLTSSEREKDVTRGYALGANAYISKPISVRALVKKVKRTVLYWLQVSNLPSNPEVSNEPT